MVMKSSNKRGLSAFVAVMVLILIIFAGTGIIWVVVKKTVDEGLEESKSCYDVLGKVEIINDYTCYDSTEKEMHFSIGIGDADIDGLLIAISREESSDNFNLDSSLQTISNLRNLDGSVQVKMPDKNAGSTYIASEIETMPVSVEVIPVVNGNTCTGEKFTDIYSC